MDPKDREVHSVGSCLYDINFVELFVDVSANVLATPLLKGG